MVDRETVKKVAGVARLNLSDKEAGSLTKDLEEILKAFESLQKAKTDGVEPSFQPLPMENVLRDDKVEPCLSQAEALAQTKAKEKGYFKGPRAV